MKGKKYIIGMLGLTVAGALVLTGCGNNKNSEQKDEGKKLVCTLDMSSELSGLGNMSTDGTVYKNINKTYVVRKIEKRLKRLLLE